MKVEITKEQYDQLKGKGILVGRETVYFIITGAKAAKPTTAKASSCPLTNVRIEKGFNTKLTGKQKLAMAAVLRVLPVADYMARGELGITLAKELKSTRDMGSYYVSSLLKSGALGVVK